MYMYLPSLPPHHASWSQSARLGSLCYTAASRQSSVFTGVVFPWFLMAGLPWEAIFIPCIGSLAGPSDLETRVLQFWEIHLCHLFDNFLLSTSSLLELLLIRGWTSWIDFLNFLFFPPYCPIHCMCVTLSERSDFIFWLFWTFFFPS